MVCARGSRNPDGIGRDRQPERIVGCLIGRDDEEIVIEARGYTAAITRRIGLHKRGRVATEFRRLDCAIARYRVRAESTALRKTRCTIDLPIERRRRSRWRAHRWRGREQRCGEGEPR